MPPPARLAGLRHDLGPELFECGDVDLGERGEGLDDIAQHPERNAGPDGQRGLLEPLTGLGAQGVRPGQTVTVAEQGHEAVGLGVVARVGSRLGHVG